MNENRMDKHNPQRYIQEPGAIERCRELLGDSLIVAGKRAWVSVQTALQEPAAQPHFDQYASSTELTQLTDAGRDGDCRRILIIGGGRAIDVGKACATRLERPAIVVPTVFSTDAPCSSLSVIYDDDQQPDEYLDHKRNPSQVIVDLDLMASSPRRYFAAGLAGGLSVFYEAEEIFASRRFQTANSMEGHLLMSAQWAKQRLLRLCEDYCQTGEWDSQKKLADACFICFWMTADCFEHLGISLPHTIYRLLRGIGVANVGGYLHGELVGLGLICQTLLCPTHRVESVRIEQLISQILHQTDWQPLVETLSQKRDAFFNQCDRWPINDNISTTIPPDALYNCVLDVAARLT